jgi:hypothetical protein
MNNQSITINANVTIAETTVFKMTIELPHGLAGIDGKFDQPPKPSTDNDEEGVKDGSPSLHESVADWLHNATDPCARPFNYSKSATEDNLRQLGYKVARGQHERGLDDTTIWVKDGHRAVFVDGKRGFFSAHQGCCHPVSKAWFEMFLA